MGAQPKLKFCDGQTRERINDRLSEKRTDFAFYLVIDVDKGNRCVLIFKDTKTCNQVKAILGEGWYQEVDSCTIIYFGDRKPLLDRLNSCEHVR